MNAINLQAENQKLKAELEELQQQLDRVGLKAEYEQHLSKQIVEHATRRNAAGLDNIRCEQRPQGVLERDLFLVAKRPEGGAYVLLGDFAGQGLATAIGSMPVSETFFTMAAKNLSVGEMATEMNATLFRLLPNAMNFSACLIEMDGKGDRVNIWSGGMQDIYMYELAKGSSRRLPSLHSPLGSVDEQAFNAGFSRLYCRQGDSLLLFTDAVVSARNVDGEEFGEQRLQQAFDAAAEQSLDGVMKSFDDFMASAAVQDKVTLAHLVCRGG